MVSKLSSRMKSITKTSTVIYKDLCQGKVLADSRTQYQRIIQRLVEDGAEAIILGCTEISMLIGPLDSPVPVFDTASIHTRKAVEWALSVTMLNAAPR